MESNSNEPILFCCILEIGKGTKMLKMSKELGLVGGTICLGRGAVRNEWLNKLGILETRKEIFQICLKGRNTELGIDYEKLASMTENRVSSDIRLIIDTAARLVFKRKIEKISQEIIEEAIKKVEPTVSLDEISECEKIREVFKGIKHQRPRVGFK